MNTDFNRIPATEGVYKVAKGEGERFDVAGARFTWKVKGDKTAYAFSVYEQTLEPGEGVPPHGHAYAEVFYLLGGAVDFLRIIDAKEDWVAARAERPLLCRRMPCMLFSIKPQLPLVFSVSPPNFIKRSLTKSPGSTLPSLSPGFRFLRPWDESQKLPLATICTLSYRPGKILTEQLLILFTISSYSLPCFSQTPSACAPANFFQDAFEFLHLVRGKLGEDSSQIYAEPGLERHLLTSRKLTIITGPGDGPGHKTALVPPVDGALQ